MLKSSLMTNSPIAYAKIHWNDVGTPISENFDDIYFSNDNGLNESRYVFLKQNQLPERWETSNQTRFVIAETGFGTGLNFLTTWQAFLQFSAENPQAQTTQLHFISFEKFPVHFDDLKKAHQAWPELSELAEQLRQIYPLAIKGCHRCLFAQGKITLDLWFGDVKDNLPQVWSSDNGIVDCWYLDGFAPSKNPDMWHPIVFNEMARLAKSQCSLATFTAAGFVRRGLIDAGFLMKKVPGFAHKREMLIGELVTKTKPQKQTNSFQTIASTANNDIAIIGGGIASASLALALVQRGKKVTLYCAHNSLGQGASGNRQGAIYPLLNNKDSAVNAFFTPAFLFARQFIDDIAQNYSFDHDWCGVTLLAYNEKNRRKQEKMLACDLPSQFIHSLSKEHINKLNQLDIDLAGIYFPQGGWLCPEQLTQAIITKAKETNLLRCHFNHEITSFSHKNNQWQLQSTKGITHHASLVIANGHQFDQFAQSASIPIYPVRGQVSHINTTTNLKKLKTVLCYDGYLTPHNPKNNTHCIGASYNRNETSLDFRSQDQIENKQKLINCIEKKWPDDADTNNNEGRVAVRCASRDHLPFVGNLYPLETPENKRSTWLQPKENPEQAVNYPNLYCLLALGSRGLTSAPLLGELLASQICADPLPLPIDVLNSLHPDRMRLKRWIKENKQNRKTVALSNEKSKTNPSLPDDSMYLQET